MRLPVRNWRDRLNLFRQDCKFRYVPFRAYYKYRSHKIMRRTDPEMGLMKFLIDRSRVSFDVGANMGAYTYLMAKYSTHVHAFEPNPYPLRILKCVVDDNVTIHHMGMSDKSGEVPFAIHRVSKGWSSNGASLDHDVNDPDAFKFNLNVKRIDDLGLPPVGFIKIDVEGHEKEVIAGAMETINRDRPNIMLENEYIHARDKFFEVFEALIDAGYEGYFLENGNLKHFSAFSLEQHQIMHRREPENAVGNYVRNFIFMPKEDKAARLS